VPSTITVAAGQSSGNYSLSVPSSGGSGPVTVTATFNGGSVNTQVQVYGSGLPQLTAIPNSFVLGPSVSTTVTAICCTGWNPTTNPNVTWSASGQPGSVSPPGPSNTTVYTAPSWWPGWTPIFNQQANITATPVQPVTTSATAILFLQAPTGTAAPTSGTYSVNNAVTFTMTAKDLSTSAPWTDTNDYMILQVSSGNFQPSNMCNVQYKPATGTLYLQLNDGSWASGTLASGVSTSGNSLCYVQGGGTASLSGVSLTLTVPVHFKPAFAGGSRAVSFNQYLSNWDGPGTVGSIVLQ
jgi:hypothetical protein